ncbi:hypothetical protein RN001_008570 [Aquatica leii]|uniref:Uncharacterized protein n=1 Tax=Aquatica leii TaxID=1421715 RepID=A0AAN7SHB4_9COLE|nr:hypothetical protein RN001_008570 [Aquatica leii]
MLETNSKIESFFKNTSGDSSQNSSNENYVVTDVQIPSTSAAVEETTDVSNDLTTSRNVSSPQSAMPQSILNVLDPSSWGNLSVDLTDLVIRNLPKHLLAIKDCDFSKSKRHYPENPDIIPGAPDSIVILPPLNANDAVTDEDSGDEDQIVLNNLPGSQLRAEAEVMYNNIFDDNVPPEIISRTTSNNDLWDSEDELLLSSLIGDKKKRAGQSRISKTKKVSVTWSNDDLVSSTE